ncbi:MAG TPA: ABC transporter ATP-binding protein [Dehalococcoidia bacterium]|nr:ABC transporter ATP-binding protein [Dehalococcoidia bacterium]
MTPAIEINGVEKSYGATRALTGIDLRVEPGRIFGFLGPNGAGKTTMIRILLDLIRPDAGTATVLGFDCQRQSIEVRRRVGYLPGDLRLYEGMRGDEFLDFIDSFRPEKRDAAYRRALVERMELDLSRRIRALSKGNRQKLGLVQALLHRPELLVLDEPTSGLDPLVQDEVVGILEACAAEGRTVFFSSHVLPEVEKISQSVAIIRAGKIVAVEEVAKLKSRSVHVIEVTFATAPPHGLFALPGVRELRRDGTTVHLQAHDGLDAVLKAIATQRVLDLRTQQPSLEDVFLSFYTEGETQEEAQRASA